MRTTIYFVRHAEPIHSHEEDRSRPLSEEGKKDTQEVTAFFRDLPVTAYYSSPYLRAKETISASAEEKGLNMEEKEGFRERESGPHGNTRSYFQARWADFTFHEPGGESLGALQERNLQALREVLLENPGGAVVIGTHGSALSTILHAFDKTLGLENFLRIIDYMPYIVKLTFEEGIFVSMEEVFFLKKPYQKSP